MIKTITDLTIRKWRDIDTYEITDESLIIEYIDESGKTNKTGRVTQSSELGYWDADSDEWEDILNAWNENKPWNPRNDEEQDWQLLSQYLRDLTDEQSDELSDNCAKAHDLRNQRIRRIRIASRSDNCAKAHDLRNIGLIMSQAESLTKTGRDVLANLLQNDIPVTQSSDIYERMANED